MSNPASRKSSGKGPRYTPPKERGRKFDKKRLGETLTKFGSAIKPFSIAHPVIVGLGVMVAAKLANTVLLASTPMDKLAKTGGAFGSESYEPIKNCRQDVIYRELNGLYWAADGVTKAVVAVPFISAGAQIVGGILSAKSPSE